jgi:hypothetical protein
MVGGGDSVEVALLARTAAWQVDLNVRAIGGIATGIRYSRTAIPDVQSGIEYLRGQTVHPYIQYAVVMRLGDKDRSGRGLLASASIGPGFVFGSVEHVVAPLPVLADQRLPLVNERSTFSWRSVDIGAAVELGFVLSRYAILGVAYTRWIGRADVPERIDMIRAPDFSVILHHISPYTTSLQKHELRLGIGLTI